MLGVDFHRKANFNPIAMMGQELTNKYILSVVSNERRIYQRV